MKEQKTKIFLTVGFSAIIALAIWALCVRPASVQVTTRTTPANASDPTLKAAAPAVAEAWDSSESSTNIKEVLEGITQVPAQAEVEAFLEKYGRTESNLLAANALTLDSSYLEEALQLFPDNPNVLVAILSQKKSHAKAIELAATLTFLEPDNALGHYLHGKALLDAGEIDAAFTALSDGASSSSFEATLTEQIEGLTAFREFQGSSPDLALVQSVFGSQMPHLSKMRQLSNELTTYNSQDEKAVSIGVAMGNHLSQGAASHLLINQLVGLQIEKKFLENLPPKTFNPFLNQTHEELLQDIESQSKRIGEIVKELDGATDQMTIEQAANYARTVMEEGEETAIRETFYK